MALNRLTVTFIPCTPSPANGYSVFFRPIGSDDDYRDGGNFVSSPAVIDDINDPEGTDYEGYIRGDCGNGNFGLNTPFTTE